ncbi:MAG: hypothetical protein AB1664_13660, partial [Thermodesulfobacteriota bacterium]
MKISLLVAVLVCSLAMWNTPIAWTEPITSSSWRLRLRNTPIAWGEHLKPDRFKLEFKDIRTLLLEPKSGPTIGTFIVATRCEEAQKQLAAVIENPDVDQFAKIKEALGLDIPITCDTTEGLVACIQCIDKDRSLRAVQLLLKPNSKRVEL